MNHRPPTTVAEKDRFNFQHILLVAHAQSIDANKDVRRHHIFNRTSIFATEHHQSDSTCNEGYKFSLGNIGKKIRQIYQVLCTRQSIFVR
nr:hypothetical protein [Tanacetum cinerariifolium]